MKKPAPWNISLFIFLVIGMLATIAAIYPKEGITVGDITLRFPTLQEFLAAEEPVPVEPILSPEELLSLRAEEARRAEEIGFLQYFQSNPSRIHWPMEDSCTIGDSTYFDNLYTALSNARQEGIHIVHYGDSQIEEDRITQVLRRQLQERFGGGGAGLIPLYQSIPTVTIGQYTTSEPKRYLVYGNKTFRREDSNQYGPMGQVAVIDTTIGCTITPRSKITGLYSAHYCNLLTLLSRTDSTLLLTVKGKTTQISSSDSPLQITKLSLPDSTTSLTLQISGKGEIYGILLGQTAGVEVDNIPMRGCSGMIFTSIQAAQLRTYYKTSNTRLIILQYGGNNVPHLYTEKGVDAYIAELVRQVHYLQRQAPEAAILFIGPSDMTTRRGGILQTYPLLPYFEKNLRKQITQAGAAYWSLYDTMGGENSMQQWVKVGLAGSDYIHFTRKGAEDVGNMLCDALLNGYKFYLWRNNLDE